MMDWIDRIASVLGAADYERHAICLTNDALLITIYTAADLVIWASYTVISVALIIARHRGVTPRPVAFELFAAFICLCGFTHLVKTVTLYTGIYRLDVMVTLATAIVSAFTAVFVVIGTAAKPA